MPRWADSTNSWLTRALNRGSSRFRERTPRNDPDRSRARPATLPPIRRSELTRVRTLAKAGSLNSRTIGSRYTVVRDDLCRAKHSECSYCERNNSARLSTGGALSPEAPGSEGGWHVRRWVLVACLDLEKSPILVPTL